MLILICLMYTVNSNIVYSIAKETSIITNEFSVKGDLFNSGDFLIGSGNEQKEAIMPLTVDIQSNFSIIGSNNDWGIDCSTNVKDSTNSCVLENSKDYKLTATYRGKQFTYTNAELYMRLNSSSKFDFGKIF